MAIRHQASVEKGVVRSARVLFDKPADGEKKVQVFEPLIDTRAAALLAETKAVYALEAAQRKVAAARAGDDGRRKGRVDVARRVRERQRVFGLPSGTGQWGRAGIWQAVAPRPARGQAPGGGLPQHMTAEATILLGKKKTALEIRDFLAGEFEPLPLATVMTYLRAREQAGLIRLVRR